MTKKKTFSIAISGKGGVGKTNTSAMLTRYFSQKGNLIAIDADPDTNLPQALGVSVDKTLGLSREIFAESAVDNPKTKEELHTFGEELPNLIKHTDLFDIIVMGRAEGEGCYCGVNHVIRNVIDKEAKSYDFTIVDCEAGLEHLSRRTTEDIDLLISVTDPSTYGIMAVKSIKEITEELLINFGHMMLVVTKVTPDTKEFIDKLAEENGLKIDAYIPYDPEIAKLDALGESIFSLPDDSIAYSAVEELGQQIQNLDIYKSVKG